jgi:hypothetical protein
VLVVHAGVEQFVGIEGREDWNYEYYQARRRQERV